MKSYNIIRNTPTLITERLILRRFTEDDVQALFEILNDREVNTFLPWFPADSLEEAQMHLNEKYLNMYEHKQGWHYAICFKEENVPIGYVNISESDSHDLGYGLKKEFWHRGIMTEACRALIKELEISGLPYVTATHDIRNPRSGMVMEQIGMQYKYSYEERVQPKDELVTFRMYQMNFSAEMDLVYDKYWNTYPVHYVEKELNGR